MASLTDPDVVALADSIHEAMCYRGTKTPTCKADRGDALLVLEALYDKGFLLSLNNPPVRPVDR